MENIVKEFTAYFKHFYKQGVKPLRIDACQAGVGTLVEVTVSSESESSQVLAKLNATFASRRLVVNQLKYDAKYNKVSGYLSLMPYQASKL